MGRNPDPEVYAAYLAEIGHCTLTPPEIREDPPLRYHPQIDDYTMSAGMARTPGGRIWLTWFGGGDDSRAFMVMAKSDDDGVTWSPPQFVLDPGFYDGIHISAVVGNLWTAPDGRLFWFFTLSLGHYDGRGGSWYAVCENPDEDHPRWSRPVRIWHGASLNKPTVLEDGTWLLPISLWTNDICRVELHMPPLSGLHPELDSERKAWIFASNDGGKTWTRRGGVRNIEPTTFDEHMLVERKDGSLLMYLRTVSGMSRTESFDGGRTWADPVPAEFPSAAARFFFRKLTGGNLLLVRYADPADPLNRSHLTAYLSEDEGVTWTGGLLLDERDRISYPDGFQDEDGRILIQYDRLREGGEILLCAFTEEDVRAGRDVSGKVFLKRPVIRSRSAGLDPA